MVDQSSLSRITQMPTITRRKEIKPIWRLIPSIFVSIRNLSDRMEPRHQQGCAGVARKGRLSLPRVAPPKSACGRYCCKSRKSNNPKNLARVDLWTFLLLRRFSALLGRSVVDFG